jgi:hypothetical protein
MRLAPAARRLARSPRDTDTFGDPRTAADRVPAGKDPHQARLRAGAGDPRWRIMKQILKAKTSIDFVMFTFA